VHLVEPDAAQALVLILTGSGRLDRDSNGPLHLDVNLELANAIAAKGIASLRYDKRGAGRSGGDFFPTGVRDNYSDAVAATEWLASPGWEPPPYPTAASAPHRSSSCGLRG
jgi:uncharacterized protein